MDKQEFKTLLEEVFLEGYNQAELDCVQEKMDEWHKDKAKDDIDYMKKEYHRIGKPVSPNLKRGIIAGKAFYQYWKEYKDSEDPIKRKMAERMYNRSKTYSDRHANESNNYFDLESEYNFYLEARNDTVDDVVRKDFLRGVYGSMKKSLPKDHVNKIMKASIGLASKHKNIDKKKVVEKFKKQMDEDPKLFGNVIKNAYNATNSGIGRIKAEYDFKDRTAKKAGELGEYPEKYEKDRDDYYDAVKRNTDKLTKTIGKTAYKAVVAPKYDKEKIIDKLKKGNVGGAIRKFIAKNASNRKKELNKITKDSEAARKKWQADLRKQNEKDGNKYTDKDQEKHFKDMVDIYRGKNPKDDSELGKQLQKEAKAAADKFSKNKKQTKPEEVWTKATERIGERNYHPNLQKLPLPFKAKQKLGNLVDFFKKQK